MAHEPHVPTDTVLYSDPATGQDYSAYVQIERCKDGLIKIKRILWVVPDEGRAALEED